jgi:hypothetical protein
MGIQVVRRGPIKITKAKIDGAWNGRSPQRRLVIGHAECRGLALVVNPTTISWTCHGN